MESNSRARVLVCAVRILVEAGGGSSGTSRHLSFAVHGRNNPEPPPSRVMHSLPLHRKKTLPWPESNVRKFERRDTSVRSGYFCSSASAYSVKKRDAEPISANRIRANNITRLEFFCSNVA